MENYDAATTSPEIIRQVLKAQDENIHHLRTIVSSITRDNFAELQKTLSEQLRLLEDIEQRLWATFLSSPSDEHHIDHRMTMTIDQYY
ncbi:MAG: hypothetical protein IT262_21530 [Saprospiraceae bacterium]|nr:hypothetical protein [Saprospiraceae bacterium]